MDKPSSFPKDFLWGASTAAHQVEGGNHNQWSEWELANAERLAATVQQRLTKEGIDWHPFKTQVTDPVNYISGAGVDHYHRNEEDFNILKSLNMNSFRFGIEWSRLQPREGEWDETEIAHYHAYIAALKARGIEPILTLWHWTMPTWFTDKGGFENKQNLEHWEAYVTRMAAEFGDDVHYWLTLNEPNVYAAFSYINGQWPPQCKSLMMGFRVYRNLVAAHRLAYKIIKQMNPSISVGLSQNLSDSRPLKPANPVHHLTAWLRDYGWNWWFINKIKSQADFIGINYYFTSYIDSLFRERNPATPRNDLNWYMEPSGLGSVLIKTWQRYKLPLIITENGLADASDTQRQWWIEQSIIAMERAVVQGVDLRGYMHWSLIDNFEWAYGWWPEFGLVHVDRKTMRRTVRPSARWFAAQIQHRHRR